MRIAIIGAGMAGLSCARALVDVGLHPVVFDKGRGIGGRVATRRGSDGIQFDHGAQFATATSPEFQSVLDSAKRAGWADDWVSGGQALGVVGVPGMTGLAKHLADGVEVKQSTEVHAIEAESGMWHLNGDGPLGAFDLVVCTAPAPQTAVVCANVLPNAADLDAVRYDACLTLMVALDAGVDLPDTQVSPTEEIAWIARDSSKPGRGDAACWVVQATPEWSVRHLEMDKPDICALLLERFLSHCGAAAKDVRHAAAHRWRYAQVAQPLGRPFLTNQDNTLYAGGDWALGPKVEHAWKSGTEIARDLLRQHDLI
ncbi:NAD(P)/FAD-dependent oxidoreductase [Marivita hallyeonensis]|uniref:Amine oxidase domain-containing protein n=1 Tax=Marivita hallyeonensis TaxID=996342 RepID=A0A1M5PIU6_9RHOB|nr:FAD-dependent oxidoreductase [Marivita hallyeonensis]SHH01651.1 hypothetical protein SAMN05443551_1317 [Marivita hallyeonensis]